ncbi:MAG: hypothetical protein WD896_00835 [Parcubacteria group bacterium]
MKIEDLVQLLNNRLREFKLSKDYAKMNGDLARINAADKEIIALEDTLYQLNLLVDTSKSAAAKKTTLAEVISDGSVAVLGEYDITPYATDPLHEEKIMNILSKMGVMDTVEKIDDYVNGKYLSSPITGEMIMSAAEAYIVDARLMMAIMEQDSRFGTTGVAVRTLNPGNVGNDDGGNTRTYESWQEGATAVAEWLSRHRGSTIIPEVPEEATATSTPPIITPTATSTPVVTTATTTTITTIPITSTSTPITATSTPVTSTTTPVTATSTPSFIEPTTSTTTPITSTSTDLTSSPEGSSEQATSTPVTTTSTTTPVTTTATSTVTISTPTLVPTTATSTAN